MSASGKTLSPKELERRREIELPKWVYGVLIYCLAVAFFQGGWSTALVFYGTVLLLSLFFVLAMVFADLRHKPRRFIAASMTLATMIWFYLSDSYRYGLDLLWDVLGIVVGGLVFYALAAGARQLLSRLGWSVAPMRGSKLVIGIVIGGWFGVTAIDALRASELPVEPTRFGSITYERSLAPVESERWKNARVGVALSGGGYRAAVFHTGTLEAFESLGIRPAVVSAVSGGAIIGSYYARGGDLAAFRQAVIDGRFNLKREMGLLHNAVRLPAPVRVPGVDVRLFPWVDFSRLDVQKSLLRKRTLGDDADWPVTPEGPELLLATTDLAYGFGIGFLKDGIAVRMSPSARYVFRGDAYRPKRPIDFTSAVAASGAFPVAFPPTQFKVSLVPYHASGTGERTLYLSDGGVADNLGVDMLLAARSNACKDENCKPAYSTNERWAVGAVLVSDAGAIGGVATDVAGIEALSRAFDAVSAQKSHGGSDDEIRDTWSFSAKQAFGATNDMLFNIENGRGVAQDTSKAGRIRVDLERQYPEQVLEVLLSLLSEQRRAAARAALAEYASTHAERTAFAYQHIDWYDQLTRTKTAAECRAAFGKKPPPSRSSAGWIPGVCAAVAFQELVQEEVRECLLTFREVDTLNSWLTSEQVDKVHRLGQLLVYATWPSLRDQIDRSLEPGVE